MTQTLESDITATDVLTDWLADFAALLAGDDRNVFAEQAWWRDVVAFTWDYRSFLTTEALTDQVARARRIGPAGFTVSTEHHATFSGDGAVLGFFDFETPTARCQGVAHLRQDDDGQWRAIGVLTTGHEFKGHEWLAGHRRRLGRTQPGGRSWGEQRALQQEFAEGDPEVMIVGAGQAGLAVAARLGTLDVPALVIDRNPRVGDNWRNRYRSLVLHDPVWFDHLPYLDFPRNWPVFTPKDKMGDWLELYASAMELNVWTGSAITEADYNDTERRWTVTVTRADDTTRVLRPRHLVIATGMSGNTPYLPEIKGSEQFTGELKHSVEFKDPDAYRDQRVLVVGAGTSAHDLAEALSGQGAQVTMLQRSETYVIGMQTMTDGMGLYQEGSVPAEQADLVAMSVPTLAGLPEHRERIRQAAITDADILSGLTEAGYRLTTGPEDAGHITLFLQKAGGYYIDVGACELIINGTVAIKSGVEIDHLTADQAVFTDGSTLEVDAIFLATGYHGVLESTRHIVGDEQVARCGPVWGLDAEGELRGVWRPTGHDGLWFAGGNLGMVRHASKFLALQLQADLLGLRD